jgi:hypothetical protein
MMTAGPGYRPIVRVVGLRIPSGEEGWWPGPAFGSLPACEPIRNLGRSASVAGPSCAPVAWPARIWPVMLFAAFDSAPIGVVRISNLVFAAMALAAVLVAARRLARGS